MMKGDEETHRLYRRVLVSVFLFSIPILRYHNAQSGTVNEKGLTRVCCDDENCCDCQAGFAAISHAKVAAAD